MTREQISLFDSYDDFTEKFKPKKTTDDCYTPPAVYDAVRAWVVRRYGLEGREIVRPFWPGKDYEREDYPKGCVVIDNPPFSILSRIEQFFLEYGIDFFLFGPGLTIFKADSRLNYVVCDLGIRYENGAEVPTSFVTNLGDCRLQTAPELTRTIRELQRQNKQKEAYIYPDQVITAAKLRYIDGKGISLQISGEVAPISKLDNQNGKTIFGRGFLVSDAAAAQAAAAQAAAAQAAAAQAAAAQAAAAKRWELSEREKEIVSMLAGEQCSPLQEGEIHEIQDPGAAGTGRDDAGGAGQEGRDHQRHPDPAGE